MCGPAVMIGMALMTAYGQQQEGKQKQAWGNYQAEQAQADANAERGVAEVQADQIRKESRRRMSAANAASAASGVTTGEGSALEIQKDITAGAEQDAQMTIFGAADSAARRDQEGAAFKIQGNDARSAANINSATTLMSAGSKINWKTMKAA